MAEVGAADARGMTVRAIREEEYDAFLAVDEESFGESPPEDAADQAVLRASLELDRTRAAFAGDRLVGSSTAISMAVSVPGGSLAMAGLSAVGVAPDHRRRGVMRAMVLALLADARERGEPLAGLFASQWPLYGRFGFGMAVPLATLQVILDGSGRTGTVGGPGPGTAVVEMVSPGDALTLLPPVHEAVAAQRGGVTSRSPAWWRLVLHEFATDRSELGGRRCAVARGRAGVEGYVLYHFQGAWSVDALPMGKVTVVELVGTTTEATAALWRHVLDTDLARTLDVHWRPLDDPLPLLLADPRQARMGVRDGLFLRLLDLPAAFAGRRAASEDSVRFAVRDELVDGNSGTWRISAPDGPGAPLRALRDDSGAAAEVAGDVAALSALYLGGESALRLRDAGLLSGAEDAARRLDALLATDRAPWALGEF